MLFVGREGIGRTKVAAIEVYFCHGERNAGQHSDQSQRVGKEQRDAYGARFRSYDSTAPFLVRARDGEMVTKLRARRVGIDSEFVVSSFGGRTGED